MCKFHQKKTPQIQAAILGVYLILYTRYEREQITGFWKKWHINMQNVGI